MFKNIKSAIISRHVLLGGSIVLIIAILTIGLYTDKDNFIGNLLAEILGVLLGIFITLIIVEEYIKSEKDKELKSIRHFSFQSITWEICFIFSKYHMAYQLVLFNIVSMAISIDFAFRKGNLSSKTLKLMKNTVDTIVNLNKEELLENIDDEQVKKVILSCEPNLHTINEVLIPRIIQISDDYELINVLITYERMLSQQMNDYPLYQQELLSKESMFNSTLSVLTTGVKVVSAIQKKSDIDDSIITENVKESEKLVQHQFKNYSNARKGFDSKIKLFKSEIDKYRKEASSVHQHEINRHKNEVIVAAKELCIESEKLVTLEADAWYLRIIKLADILLLPINSIDKQTNQTLVGLLDDYVSLKNKDELIVENYKELKQVTSQNIGLDDDTDEAIVQVNALLDRIIILKSQKISDIDKLTKLMKININTSDT